MYCMAPEELWDIISHIVQHSHMALCNCLPLSGHLAYLEIFFFSCQRSGHAFILHSLHLRLYIWQLISFPREAARTASKHTVYVSWEVERRRASLRGGECDRKHWVTEWQVRGTGQSYADLYTGWFLLQIYIIYLLPNNTQISKPEQLKGTLKCMPGQKKKTNRKKNNAIRLGNTAKQFDHVLSFCQCCSNRNIPAGSARNPMSS